MSHHPPSTPVYGRRRRRAARRDALIRIAGIGAIVVTAIVTGALILGAQFKIIGHSLDAPDAPRISERAATMLRASWRPVLGSDYYRLTVYRGLRAVRSFKVEGTEAQIPNLSKDTSYRVRVAAVDARGSEADEVSGKSDPAVARTLGDHRPALLMPTSPTVAEARNTSLAIGWEPVETASAYELQLSTDTHFTKPRTAHAEGRRGVFDYLDAATTYFVRIRAKDAKGGTSDWTPPFDARTIQPTDPLPLAIASYNVKCHSCGGPSWNSRRSGVAATIASRGLDVVGLQEAQQSGGPQFEDLLTVLNAMQAGWQITDGSVDGTLGDRIFYNTHTLKMLDHGGGRYHHQGNSDHYHQRYFTWGLFRQRSSGKRFLFFNSHLDPDSVPARVAQGRELALLVAKMGGKVPAIVVGDLNASQYHQYDVHDALTSAGLVDPLGVLRASHAIGAGATVERRINTNYDSFNNFSSRPSVSVGPGHNGTYIDYIFTTPMRVIEYENVVNVDNSGRYRVAASDHNMLRAIVGLP